MNKLIYVLHADKYSKYVIRFIFEEMLLNSIVSFSMLCSSVTD